MYFGSDLDLCHDHIHSSVAFLVYFFFLHLFLFSPKPENHGASNRAPVVMRELIKVVDHSASIGPLQACLFS